MVSEPSEHPPPPEEFSIVAPQEDHKNIADTEIHSSTFQTQPGIESEGEPAPKEDHTLDIERLTPLRAHYLKKTLIQLQFRKELDAITTAPPNNVSTLSYLGSPFAPPPKGSPSLDLPFLRYFFRSFILSFPFLASAPKDFYSDKLQPFVSSVFARNLSPTSLLEEGEEGSDQAFRLKLLAKVERHIALLFSAGLKLVEPEEVVRLKQSDLDRLEELAKKRQARLNKFQDVFEVNVVSVRSVTDKGRVRSKVHEEFIIRTRISKQQDVFVSRRYGDFRTLSEELRKAHPNEEIRPPPAKDRTSLNIPTSNTSPPNGSDTFSDGSSDSLQQSSPSNTPPRLSREKNRLTLRAYLHALMNSASIASSPVLRSFLLSGPTTLTAEEEEDVKRREEADKLREDGRKHFAREIASRVDGLRDAVRSVKGDIMGKDGLTRVFSTIKETPDIGDLPDNYKAVIEWARISLASTIFHVFVASDNSSETYSSLKRIHGLMPYFVLRTALKISNPVSMIRSILDIFLAQPFGGRSLLQRMFTSSLNEEVKNLEEDVAAVKEKVDDPIICDKIRQFIYAPREIQDMYKRDAAAENMSLISVVLRSGEQPVLNRSQMQRIVRAHRAHATYMKYRETLNDSDDDDGPQDDDAWLFEDLKILSHLYSRLRDREQLIALIFEGVTSDLLKDIITIFYAPLAQVYRAASIADSLGDLQNFINDLIRTVDSVEELGQEDPQRTVQTFIDLVSRHQQAFYAFVYKVHSKGSGLFDSLMRWIELFLTVVREGFGQPISLEYLLPHTGGERTEIIAEVDKVALYHYKLKLAYEDKVRKRFNKAQGGQGGQSENDADAENEATQMLVEGVMGEISFGELVQGDADDVAAQDTDESGEGSDSGTDSEDDDSEDDSEDDDDEESQSTEESVRPPPPPAKTQPIGRSRTALVTSSRPPQPEPRSSQDSARPRPRSLSLRSSKSISSLFTRDKERERGVPPVPPRPKAYVNGNSSGSSNNSHNHKPLPPAPRTSTSSISPSNRPPISEQRKRSLEGQAQARSPRAALPSPLRKSKEKKGKADVLKQPELTHIPQLLPLFVELMKPILRTQRR